MFVQIYKRMFTKCNIPAVKVKVIAVEYFNNMRRMIAIARMLK